MLIQTKKTILILMITTIMVISMLFVYQDFLKHKGPEKKLLDDSVLIIYPGMTEIAYVPNSFYSFYKGECDDCKTHSLKVQKGNRYNLGMNGHDFFFQSYYDINDLDIQRLPPLLYKYDSIILLHNEYVTQKVFDEITNHPNVIYLYPNSLYGKVEISFEKQEMTLVRGHGYPSPEIGNGFDWKDDNTPQEKDCEIGKWHFHNVTNGIQLDCYPENIINHDKELQDYIYKYLQDSKTSRQTQKLIPEFEKLK